MNEWKRFEQSDMNTFLDAVRSDDHSILSEPALCEVFSRPLDFFDGYDLVRISNQYSPPFMIFDYVSNGENHYYLDGSDYAFQTLCTQKSVRLTEENVLEYIDMYFSYVYERGNSIVFIRDGQDTNFKGSDGMGVHFKALQTIEQVSVQWSEEEDAFIIRTPLLYQDQTRKGVIHVSKNGRIDVRAPLEVSFLSSPKGFDTVPVIHPKANEILRQTRDLLGKTTTGKRLLDIADEKDVEIHIMGSPNYQAITTNKPAIYLFMPAAQFTADIHQALQLGGALRDMEQILGGFPRPSPEEPPEVFFAINYDKNLNLLCEICKIVDEFEALNMPEALAAMRRLGIEDVYGGYKNKASPDEMLTIYISMMMKQGFILEQ
jgi:hypothetical protein